MTLTDLYFPNRITFTTLENMIDQLFYKWDTNSKPPVSAIPILDEAKNKVNGVNIQYALAGFKEEDLNIWHENNVLYVKGDNTYNKDISDKFKCYFKQRFPVSKELDLSKTEIKLENGLLSIIIPIAEKEDKKIWLLGG